MQIVILAGGKGTRLGSLTNNVPKPLLKINGVPFLEILITYLKQQNFSKFVLSVGYLSDQIKNHFLDGKELDVEIKYSVEHKSLGTGGAILNSISMLEDEFIVINGDTFLDLDYKKFIDFSQKNSKLCTVVGFLNLDSNKDFINNLFINNKSEVKLYSKNKLLKNLNYVDAGVYFFKKTAMKYCDNYYPLSLECDVFPKLIADNQMGGFATNSKFYDIGTHEKIDKFTRFLQNTIRKQHFNH